MKYPTILMLLIGASNLSSPLQAHTVSGVVRHHCKNAPYPAFG